MCLITVTGGIFDFGMFPYTFVPLLGTTKPLSWRFCCLFNDIFDFTVFERIQGSVVHGRPASWSKNLVLWICSPCWWSLLLFVASSLAFQCRCSDGGPKLYIHTPIIRVVRTSEMYANISLGSDSQSEACTLVDLKEGWLFFEYIVLLTSHCHDTQPVKPSSVNPSEQARNRTRVTYVLRFKWAH